MNEWDTTRTSTQRSTDAQPYRSRHRAPQGQSPQLWSASDHWRTQPPRRRRRAVSPDEAETTKFPPLSQQHDQPVTFPGTGSIRSVIGTWAVLNADTAPARMPAQVTDEASPSGHPNASSIAAIVKFPQSHAVGERGIGAYIRHTAILSGRQLTVWTRDRATLLQTLLFPALSMIMFKVVLGDALGRATGQNSAFGTVPLVVLVGAMFGSLASGVRLSGERKTGLLTRLYVMPIHRGADLSARIITEIVRILIGTILLTLLGMIIGWRFNQGLFPALGIFGVALLYGAAYSTIVLTVALTSANIPLVPIMSLTSSLLMFFNSGFSPVNAYPGFLQPIVQNQPMTCAIETMRALAVGGPVAHNLIKTLIWAVVIIVVFGYPALRAYRKAASTR